MIYSNAFNGGEVDINGTAPAYASDIAGGSQSALWDVVTNNYSGGYYAYQDGTMGPVADSVLLPFIPQSGYIYTLSGSIVFTGNPGNWLAIGFGANLPASNQLPAGQGDRFNDPAIYGNPWSLFRPGTGNGGVQLYWTRTGLVGGQALIPATFPSTNEISLVLNTSGLKWFISESINGTPVTTNYIYNANPNITSIGYGQTTLTAGTYHWNTFMLGAETVAITNNTYWMAPTAVGTGDGSSSANAAGYLDSGFWSGIQSLLQATNININLLNGTYNTGSLNFNDMGDPLHRLTLQAVNPNGPVFNTTGSTIVSILGSQNIKFDGMVFTGPIQYWAVNCQPDYLKPCRDLEFSHCQFINLTNAYYGAIGLLDGVRDILVDNCTFSNLTDNNGNHQHMIYASHNILDVVVTNCLFQDCLADYIRFRDNAEYCAVKNCTFKSTMSASAWPFISAELYNDTNSDAAGDEFFGNHFQISSNSFNYNVSGGAGPYSALHFSDTGYSPYSYHCDLTPDEASQLAGGNISFQQSFLQTNMGILASGIKMFGNTYNSRVVYHTDYTYNQGNAPGNGWTGTINLNNVPDVSGALLTAIPVIRNGNFDRQGLLLTPQTSSTPNQCLFQTWFCNPKYATILRHPGFAGTANALLFNKAQNQYVYQWITPPGPMWTMDCLFAIGSGFSGSGTKFKMDLFHNDLTGGKVSVGVDNLGRIGIYNGGTFTPLPTLGTVAFSVDLNGNGNYTDSGDTLDVYRLRIVGNYDGGTPYINVYASDANSMNLNHQATELTDWVNGAPVSGQSAPTTMAFYNYTASVILDQVSLASGLAEKPPVISSILSEGGKLVLSGTNGFPGDMFYLLSSTNLTSGNWKIDGTNVFAAGGAFSITNTPLPGSSPTFYRLQLQ